MENVTDDTTDPEYINNHEELEETYEAAMVELQEKIDDLTMQQQRRNSTQETTQHQELKLPVLKLPTFNGDYNQWKSFIDLFDQAINKNEKLGNAQKMHYLKANVTGEAARLIQHLQIMDSNYEIARDALINRYENKRMLVNAQIQTLINQKESQAESAEHLRRLHDTTVECINSLKGLDIDTASWDPMILYIISQKLDNETRKGYEQSLKNPKELQPLDEFLTFLENKFHALDNLDGKRHKVENIKDTSTTRKYFDNGRKGGHRSFHTTISPSCKHCNGTHWLHSCKQFIEKQVMQRNDFVQREKLCKNCFKPNHETTRCPSQKTCQICQQRHHTLLHLGDDNRRHGQPQSNFSANTQCNKILLATAIIKTNWRGCDYHLRALIDQGSQSSFITEDAVQRLQLQRKRAHAPISGLGATHAGTAKSKVELCIKSIYPSDFQVWGSFLVMAKLTRVLPDETFTVKEWGHVKDLPLADPSFNQSSNIDMLIGADIFQDLLMEGVIKGTRGLPVAQKTHLGWILSGSFQQDIKIKDTTVCLISNLELNEQLQSFWETEEVDDERSFTVEEERCEEIFSQSHTRDETGRYVVRLPFKANAGKLGKSRDRALARFLQSEKKFTHNNQLYEDYKQFMRDYLDLGHMELVTPISGVDTSNNVYYLPHHAVVKPDSSTSKLRVVFDASSKTSSGQSLNDMLLIGPVIQQDLFSILTRWRKHKYVFRADVEKMYRQILVAEEDRNFQRILWRESPSENIKEYRLKTVTYGTSSAPFLAIRTLQQLAVDGASKFERASKLARQDFYVDDLLSGEDTLEAAMEVQSQIVQLMASGRFKLRKWSSNTESLLRSIPADDQEQGRFQINAYNPIKTLGIYWRPETDDFEFKINSFSTSETLTKRIIVSETARLFDPLGSLAPIIVKAKLLQQELWRSGRSWDEELPEEIIIEWKEFRKQLVCIEEIKIPRWTLFETKHRIELHGFCDASERAYAAAIYTRVITEAGNTHTTLLCAKSKVAPLKRISIPKLELCGAVLLAKLIKKTKKALEIINCETHAWTDSSITLAWITGNPTKWKRFVANRVAKITSIVSPDKWHHVKGKENPADCASRGLWPSQLKEHSTWWTGPKWISQPTIFYDLKPHTTDLEVKRVHICALTAISNQNDLIEGLLSHYSSFRRLTRVLAYCKRFISNLRVSSEKKNIGSLTYHEIWNMSLEVIRSVQQVEFKEEVRSLKEGRGIEQRSKLRSLNPFIDEQDMLRVGGRLTGAVLSRSQKHPIIIPHSGPLTIMLIDEAHKATLHGGFTLTHTHLRQQFWIHGGLSAVKQRIRRCIICFRHKAEAKTQLMGNLPQARVRQARPFLHTGVDYAGPVDIRTSKGRGNKSYKGYIAVFVCLSTKAVHIEVVSDMTANAFMAAFKRLCARRGHVGHLYSDNGTNFVGANKIMKLNAKETKRYKEEIYDFLSSNQTEWHFIPPASPHFGGLWEAGVKSLKHHLKRTIGEHKLTYEEMSTVLSQIEACLNSRPLCPLSNDPEETDALTPGHFLIGTALLAPPEKARLDTKEGLLIRWQLLERMQQQFWKKWSSEYLTTLQQRSKWTKRSENVRVGDIVLVKDEQLPPTRWSLGKISETHAGEDGLIRVVTLQVRNKTMKRPITKVCPLPIIDNDEHAEGQDITCQGNEIEPTTCLLSRNISTSTSTRQPLQFTNHGKPNKTTKRLQMADSRYERDLHSKDIGSPIHGKQPL